MKDAFLCTVCAVLLVGMLALYFLLAGLLGCAGLALWTGDPMSQCVAEVFRDWDQ